MTAITWQILAALMVVFAFFLGSILGRMALRRELARNIHHRQEGFRDGASATRARRRQATRKGGRP